MKDEEVGRGKWEGKTARGHGKRKTRKDRQGRPTSTDVRDSKNRRQVRHLGGDGGAEGELIQKQQLDVLLVDKI